MIADGAPGRARRPWWPLLFVAVATAIMLPELVWGLSASDSYRYNLLWTDEFTSQFAAGNPWPRWLSQSWDGLGAPTFYHYPPLFFWVAALIRTPLFDLVGAQAAASLASLLILAASGGAMYLWLRRFGSPIAALVGALAYEAAPYHLYDIFARGSLAEASAYAALPLVPMAIERIADRRRGGVALLAGGYALLVLGHMPSALIASISLIPAYFLYRVRPLGAAVALRGASGILLGLALSAAYLWPAIGLLPFTLSEAFGGAWFDPLNWAFWTPQRWPSAGRAMLNILFASTALIATIAAFFGRRSDADRGALRFWALLAIALFLLIAGFPPMIWQISQMTMVQFPARLMPDADFVAITALVIARPPLTRPLTIAALLLAIMGWLVMAQAMIGRTYSVRSIAARSQALVLDDRRDAPTFLPAAVPMPIAPDELFGANPSLVRLPERGWLVRGQGARIIVSQDGESIDATVETPSATTLVARRYAYPIWRVRDERGSIIVPTAQPVTGLVTWPTPAGRHHYRLEPGPAPGERASLLVSFLALMLLGLTLWQPLRSSLRKVLPFTARTSS